VTGLSFHPGVPVDRTVSHDGVAVLTGAGLAAVIAARMHQVDVHGYTIARDQLTAEPLDLPSAGVAYANVALDQIAGIHRAAEASRPDPSCGRRSTGSMRATQLRLQQSLSGAMVDHVSPALGCRCRACHGARLAIWHDCTGAQRKAVSVLSFVVPRHQTDILQRDRLRYVTITSLLYPHGRRPALIRMLYLREAIVTATSMPFFILTQHGAEISAASARLEQVAA